MNKTILDFVFSMQRQTWAILEPMLCESPEIRLVEVNSATSMVVKWRYDVKPELEEGIVCR